MSTEITIGDQIFTPARQTFGVLLELAPLQERVGDLADEVIGLQAQMDHAGGELVDLADQAGDFNANRREELKAQRSDLRKELISVAAEHFKARIELIAVRLQPQPEVEFLLEHMDADDLERVLDQLNQRPTKTPSENGNETS